MFVAHRNSHESSTPWFRLGLIALGALLILSMLVLTCLEPADTVWNRSMGFDIVLLSLHVAIYSLVAIGFFAFVKNSSELPGNFFLRNAFTCGISFVIAAVSLGLNIGKKIDFITSLWVSLRSH